MLGATTYRLASRTVIREQLGDEAGDFCDKMESTAEDLRRRNQDVRERLSHLQTDASNGQVPQSIRAIIDDAIKLFDDEKEFYDAMLGQDDETAKESRMKKLVGSLRGTSDSYQPYRPNNESNVSSRLTESRDMRKYDDCPWKGRIK